MSVPPQARAEIAKHLARIGVAFLFSELAAFLASTTLLSGDLNASLEYGSYAALPLACILALIFVLTVQRRLPGRLTWQAAFATVTTVLCVDAAATLGMVVTGSWKASSLLTVSWMFALATTLVGLAADGIGIFIATRSDWFRDYWGSRR